MEYVKWMVTTIGFKNVDVIVVTNRRRLLVVQRRSPAAVLLLLVLLLLLCFAVDRTATATTTTATATTTTTLLLLHNSSVDVAATVVLVSVKPVVSSSSSSSLAPWLLVAPSIRLVQSPPPPPPLLLTNRTDTTKNVTNTTMPTTTNNNTTTTTIRPNNNTTNTNATNTTTNTTSTTIATNTTNTTTTATPTSNTTTISNATTNDDTDDNDDNLEVYCGYNHVYRLQHGGSNNSTNNSTTKKTKVPKPTPQQLQDFYQQYIASIRWDTTTTTTSLNQTNQTTTTTTRKIPLPTSLTESMAQSETRRLHVYIYFANAPLPNPNVTSDDWESIRIPPLDDDDEMMSMVQNTNPQFNSRDDVRTFVARTISRMTLGCRTTIPADLDTILLHPATKPFAAPGTSVRSSTGSSATVPPPTSNDDITIQCHRDGDYDFALMDLLLLSYTIRQYQDDHQEQQKQEQEQQNNTFHTTNSTTNTTTTITPSQSTTTIISPEAQNVLENVLLSVGLTGTIDDATTTSYVLPCRIGNIPSFVFFLKQRAFNIYLQIDDTENHTLMSHVAKYLINQLYYTYYPGLRVYAQLYDNDANGNTNKLLKYLSSFLSQSQFYEYNSKPYQGSTMVALNLLHTYTNNDRIQMATQNILDMITVYNTVQSDHLRRFVPFRRQPQYVTIPQSWAGDGEYQRLAILTGNQNILPEIGRTECITTTQSSYTIDPIILDLFFPQSYHSSNATMLSQQQQQTPVSSTPHYFVGNTQVAEIYASTDRVLLSGGGHATPSDIGNRRITAVQRPLLQRFNIRLIYIYNKYILNNVLSLITDEERGWSRPTTIIPRSMPNEYHISSMIRFTGHRNLLEGAKTQNLCVAPNFVCGLQLEYGTGVGTDAVLSNCSVSIGNWTFLNLYHNGTKNKKICPNYGFYMAVYERPCDLERCMNKADRYGLIEILEPNTIVNHTNNIDFVTFQNRVMKNNPTQFQSEGIMTYTTMDDHVIQFEIDPLEEQASIVQYDTTPYERHYKNWPIARSRTIQSTTPGRITIDNTKYFNRRLILDMTIPTNPRRYTTTIPILRYSDHTLRSTNDGGQPRRIFDDGNSIVPEFGITKITFYTNFLFQFVGYRMEWGSGMSVTHGYTGTFHTTHTFRDDESIIIMTIGISWLWGSINYIQLQTNTGRLFRSGYFGRNQTTFISKPNENICAFYGRAGDGRIDQLGAIYTPNS